MQRFIRILPVLAALPVLAVLAACSRQAPVPPGGEPLPTVRAASTPAPSPSLEPSPTPPPEHELFVAGIHAFGPLIEAQKLHRVRQMSADEVKYLLLLGEDLPLMQLTFFTNAQGLYFAADGQDRVVYVRLNAPGYESSGGLGIGGQSPLQSAEGEDARITAKATAEGIIKQLELVCFFDCGWSEASADVNGDGQPERVLLGGKANPITRSFAADPGVAQKAGIAIAGADETRTALEWDLQVFGTSPKFIGCGDIDGDGREELLLACETNSAKEEEPPMAYTLIVPEGADRGWKAIALPGFTASKGDWDMGWSIETYTGKPQLIHKTLRDGTHSYLDEYYTLAKGELEFLTKKTVLIKN